MSKQGVRIVAGLGNPGDRYRDTRHNIGFMIADRVGERLKCEQGEARFSGIIRTCRTKSGRVIVLKPMTYMNLSGQSVTQAMRWFKVEAHDVIIIYDDLDLPFGEIRIRPKGSAAGHNGLSSVIEVLGSTDIPRLRVGIGRPAVSSGRSYVLSRFSPEEVRDLPDLIEHSSDAVLHWLECGILEAMNRYNGVNILSSPE